VQKIDTLADKSKRDTMGTARRRKKRKPVESEKRTWWHWLKWPIAIAVTLTGHFALVAPPAVDVAGPVFPTQPMSLAFDIKSRTVLPIVGLSYDCAPDIETDQGKSGGAKLVPKYQRQNQTLGWFGTTTAHCENLLRIGPHQSVKAAEMTVSLHYWQPPWIFRRNQAYDFVGIVDPADGRVRRWVHR